MGKKAKFKQIRRLANQLPEIKVGKVVREITNGRGVMNAGVTEIDGKPIEEDKFYEVKKTVPVPLNHNRKMKQQYNKHGVGGVQAYLQAVQRAAAFQKLRKEALEAEDTEKETV